MYSLIVQGLEAKCLQFKSHSGQEFRSLVESITLEKSILICSPYRVDLIYESQINRQELVMNIWCKIAGLSCSFENFQYFLQANDEVSTLQNYFASLKTLAFSPGWFNSYKVQFHRVIDQEPDHPIHQRLLDCADFLIKKKYYKVLKRFLRPHDKPAFNILLNANDIAREANNSYLVN